MHYLSRIGAAGSNQPRRSVAPPLILQWLDHSFNNSRGRLNCLLVLPIALATSAIGLALADKPFIQVAILAASIPIVFALALRSPRMLILALAAWLVVMGMVRRLLFGSGSTALLGDPLLLVEPIVIGLLTLAAVAKGALRNQSLLAKGVLTLNILALIEVVNPLQGGLTVGIGGLLFVLVPLLSFWVGRALCDDGTLHRLLVMMALLALPAATYGLVQTYRGFPSWDTRWIQLLTSTGAYASLNVEGAIRAFASFSSASEYVDFLSVAIVVWFAGFRRPASMPIKLIAIAVLATALFLGSSRGSIVLGVLAVAVMTASLFGVRMIAAALWGVAGLALMFLVVSHSAPAASVGIGPTAGLVSHQLEGLSQPLNSSDSTLGLHFTETLSGLKTSFSQPLGHGTGSITIAASKFGGSAHATEVDPGNVGVAMGLPGLLAYLVVAVTGLTVAYRLASSRRDFLSVAVLGILCVTFLQWLNGGEYAVAWLPWLTLGWADATLINSAHDASRDRLVVSSRVDGRARGAL